ncbi:hypothetical protein NBT05_17115 [Aquimarina sp. ERC-38]|uniref:RHS repeat-associated core domain-containing protein n=1 Tax=Aquimarina sp. ERC-38 TaxID=2949996 RepID=UPI0022451090|nr:RHS repeat-associated core domain-containing protein [Aquimarina sp. ERC-38]UZO80648.1 hypothetical protein NBT05_17115 [Aquimarina sp. ERC-38]
MDNDGNYLPDVVSYSDYWPFGALLGGRHGNSGEYRYGFQGQEMDNEIKGEGNSINYKYRMHDPRVGRFFATDPLAPEYPFYSPYSFSGNRIMDALELEGMEPIVINGELVAYRVQPGQGPSQIAADLNNEMTKKKYGYIENKSITWSQVVSWNYDEFKAKGDWKQNPSAIFSKDSDVYRHLNVNSGETLLINQYARENFIYDKDIPTVKYNDVAQGEAIEPLNGAFSSGFKGSDAEASAGGVGAFISSSHFEVPKESIFWEGGSTVNMSSMGAQIGTPGLATSMGAGSIDFSATSEPSLTKILNSPSHSKTVGVITTIGAGAKYTQTLGNGYSSSLYSGVAGSPGVIASYTNSSMSTSNITISGLKTRADSIARAKEILKFYPGAKHARNYLNKTEGKAKPLKVNQL